MSQVEWVTLNAGEVILKPGDRMEGIYIVVAGGAKAYQIRSGRKRLIGYCGVGDVIGLPSLIEEKPFKHYMETIIDNSTLAFVPKSVIFKLIHEHPLSFFSLFKKLNAKMNQLEARGTSVLTDSAELNVIKTINYLHVKFGTDTNGYINANIPVKELATYVGMSKTNLYRVLQTLKEKNIVSHHVDKYKLEKTLIS